MAAPSLRLQGRERTVGARPVPIAPALWARLAALDGRVDVLIRRQDSGSVGPVGQGRKIPGREWEVRVWPRGRPERCATCQAPALAAALEGAVQMAEGWR